MQASNSERKHIFFPNPYSNDRPKRLSTTREKFHNHVYERAQSGRSNCVTTSLLTPAERCQWRWPGFRDRRTREAETEKKTRKQTIEFDRILGLA